MMHRVVERLLIGRDRAFNNIGKARIEDRQIDHRRRGEQHAVCAGFDELVSIEKNLFEQLFPGTQTGEFDGDVLAGS